MGYEKILPPVLVEIGRVHAHSGARPPVFTEADLGHQRLFFPFAIAPINKQEILHRIIRDEQVHPAVVIHIRSDYTQSLSERSPYSGIFASLGKCAVSVVMEQKAARRAECARNAVVFSAELIISAGEM